MEIDPEQFKELIETFKIELQEQLQSITDQLLLLEKNQNEGPEFYNIIDNIFRSAHTIKGSSRGIGIDKVGIIAHHIESLFDDIKKKKITINSHIIDLCLESVDAIRDTMQSYIEDRPLDFDLDFLCERLDSGKNNAQPKPEKTNPNDTVAPKSKNQDMSTTHAGKQTIRVSLQHLDKISALMEEMQVNKISIDENFQQLNKINQQMQKISRDFNKNLIETNMNKNLQKTLYEIMDNLNETASGIKEINKNIRPRSSELELISNALQSEIRTLRLVPAAEMLKNFPRIVRDLAHELHKNVELNIKGEDVKMDKMVMDGLKDPLIHILRNAIDHGIETSAIRQTLGKPETGKINIEITEEGNQILITVQDDGAGIDVNKIARIAQEKELIKTSELDTFTEHEIVELIFRPGFTSKGTITDISGRGVGLDVVKENLENLKGSVSIETELGKGTTFNLRVPFSLASERGLIIQCGGQHYAIPVSHVEKVLIVTTEQIIDVSASQAIMVDNHPVPLRSLAVIFNLPEPGVNQNNQYTVVVLKKGWQTVALLVDEIIGEKEIVIKPLQAPLANIHFFAGGTLSASGTVIIVLDTGDVINEALHTHQINRVTKQTAKKNEMARPRILVVDDSITTRTMEKNVLEYKNYDVTVSVNGKEAWDLLQKEKFSLLITDASMPIMDGFTLTEKVKTSPELNKMPVIIVTSLDSDAEKKRGIDAGANAYVIKNEFESDTLLKIVEQLV